MNNQARSVVFVGEAMVELRSTAPHTADWSYAGDTLNAAAAFAQGAPSILVRYLTAIGDDELSQGLLERCRELGIDASISVRVANGSLGLYWIEAVEGEHRFRYWRDSSAAQQALSTGLLIPKLGGSSHLAWSGITLAVAGEGGAELIRAVQDARDEGSTIYYDLNHRPLLWANAEVARHSHELALATADVVTASRDDIRALWDEPPAMFAERALDVGVREVVVTDRSEVIRCTTPGGVVTHEPTPTTVVESSGAGDSFWGTYLSRRMTGDDIGSSLERAARVAARAVEHPGALGYLADAEQKPISDRGEQENA